MTTTATFSRYVNDSTTEEAELHFRSGQVVTVGDPFIVDEIEGTVMFPITFSDGFMADAFEDELCQIEEEENA